jgi:His-Xaa-Ser repeat protein HxsA
MNKKQSRLAALAAGLLSGSVFADGPPEDARSLDNLLTDPLNNINVGGLNPGLPTWLAQHRSHASHASHASHRSSSGGAVPRVPSISTPRAQPYVPRSEPLSQPSRPSLSIPSTNTTADKQQRFDAALKDSEKLKNIVMRIQLTLLVSGFYTGAVDGVMGPGTRAAINEYRRSKGLPEGETLDLITLDSLGILVY